MESAAVAAERTLVMKRLMFSAAAAATVAAGVAIPAPSFAQAQGTQAEIVVFGTDPCPRATDDAIVICRRYPETMRYRMPEAYRPSGTFQERQSWVNKARNLQTVGNTGTGSCSAVGPGGHTGCLTQEIEQARQAARQAAQEGAPPQP
jgi:hypothetical protein